jgi:hypothetical protein
MTLRYQITRNSLGVAPSSAPKTEYINHPEKHIGKPNEERTISIVSE